jgi:GGDEF domain-containing protein
MAKNVLNYNSTADNNEILPMSYPRFKLPEERLKTVIHFIKDKIPSGNKEGLDVFIIEAHLDELLFLGKLKKLDKIVKGGRGQIGRFTESLLKKILNEGAKESENFQNTLKEIIGRLKTDPEINDFMREFAGRRFTEEMEGQWNERLDIWTHGHFMTRMTRAISDKFTKSEEVGQQQLKSIGTLFFDLDGLKFLNEINRYNAGNKALWVMARALTDNNLTNWAGRNDIELVSSHHHGDEFLMGVIANDGIDLTNKDNKFIGVNGEEVGGVSLMKYIGDYVTELVNNFGQDETESRERREELISGQAISGSMGIVKKYKEDKRKNKINPPKSIRNIIDFSDPDQLNKLAEFKAQLPANLAELLKEDFKYQLSCSYGYSTLEDAVAKNVKDGLFDDSDISYEYLIYKLASKGLTDTSEAKLKIAKEFGKEKRRRSNDLRLQLLERLYRFGRETGSDDKNFKELYLQISQELMKLEIMLKESYEKISSLEKKVEERDKKIRLLQLGNEKTNEKLGDMWKWFDENN